MPHGCEQKSCLRLKRIHNTHVQQEKTSQDSRSTKTCCGNVGISNTSSSNLDHIVLLENNVSPGIPCRFLEDWRLLQNCSKRLVHRKASFFLAAATSCNLRSTPCMKRFCASLLKKDLIQAKASFSWPFWTRKRLRRILVSIEGQTFGQRSRPQAIHTITVVLCSQVLCRHVHNKCHLSAKYSRCSQHQLPDFK